MLEHVQPHMSSASPISIPQSLLISANPMASLRIFAEAERIKSQKQSCESKDSCKPTSNHGFPAHALQTFQTESSSSKTQHTRSRKRTQVTKSDSKPDLTLRSSGHQRKRLKKHTHPNGCSTSSVPSSPPCSSSLSSDSSSGDTTDSDVDFHVEKRDGNDTDDSLVPAYPSLPPTPLTPHEILQSSTLSRLFSRSNRTFHQISNSATGLVEADLKTCNRMSELVEVLRGDLGGRRWIEVVERAFLAPISEQGPDHGSRDVDHEPNSPKAYTPSHLESRRPTIEDDVKLHHAPAPTDWNLPSEPHSGHQRNHPHDQSELQVRAQSAFSASSDATLPFGQTVSDPCNDGHRSTLDPRYQILTQAPGFIQSLFVSSDAVTLPILSRPTSDGRAFHAHQQTSPIECNTAQKINGLSTTPSSKNNSIGSASGASRTETLSIQQQVDSYHECTAELSKFLGDLTDYRDRLLEIRDGCLTVEKRRLAMWAIVKLCATGYDEISTGQDSTTTSTSGSSKMEVTVNGTTPATQTNVLTSVGRPNGHTASPSQRGKNRAR